MWASAAPTRIIQAAQLPQAGFVLQLCKPRPTPAAGRNETVPHATNLATYRQP